MEYVERDATTEKGHFSFWFHAQAISDGNSEQ